MFELDLDKNEIRIPNGKITVNESCCNGVLFLYPGITRAKIGGQTYKNSRIERTKIKLEDLKRGKVKMKISIFPPSGARINKEKIRQYCADNNLTTNGLGAILINKEFDVIGDWR